MLCLLYFRSLYLETKGPEKSLKGNNSQLGVDFSIFYHIFDD